MNSRVIAYLLLAAAAFAAVVIIERNFAREAAGQAQGVAVRAAEALYGNSIAACERKNVIRKELSTAIENQRFFLKTAGEVRIAQAKEQRASGSKTDVAQAILNEDVGRKWIELSRTAKPIQPLDCTRIIPPPPMTP